VTDSALDALTEGVRKSPKYRRLAPDLIRRVGAQELAHRRSYKEAVEATRRKLHQVAGAYWDGASRPWERWLRQLREAHAAGDRELLRAACRAPMASHASTRERLPLLDGFYATLLGDLAPVRSVLDLACGLNPLAIPWMPLAEGAGYQAIDVYEDLAEFLNQAFALLPVQGSAEACDILGDWTTGRRGDGATGRRDNATADVALLLKSLPCLEQIDPAAAAGLLDRIPARHRIVSFPVHSLGGRRKGMPEQYEERFQALAAGRDWRVERFVFPTELVFRVT
jgi:16S rRNA (guanine(1405)-N(7))-methyltransferase